MKYYYIVTQKDEYFKMPSDTLLLENSKLISIQKKCGQYIWIFLYDRSKSKIYGSYKADISKIQKGKYSEIRIKRDKRRRGIYFQNSAMNESNEIFETDNETAGNINYKISVLNKPLYKSIMKARIEKDTFILGYEELYDELYSTVRKVKFDKTAFAEMQAKYINLIENPVSEYKHIDSYVSLGKTITNMFMPFKDLIEIMCRHNQIVYLDCDKHASLIPWPILLHDNKFIAEKIIFSNMYAKNVFHKFVKKRKNTTIALISIPHDDLKNANKEIDAIENMISGRNNIIINIYKKTMTYTEFIDILESNDVVHIITHCHAGGIKLSNNYTFKSISLNSLTNPPALVFLNTCNYADENKKEGKDMPIISSLLQSKVKSVIAARGSLLDNEEPQFVCNFYKNYLQPEKNVKSAIAYHFARLDEKDSYSFLRYNFFGC